MNKKGLTIRHFILLALLLIGLSDRALRASDWFTWRGPAQNGSSPETGLISNWTVDGENQIWRADFVGRSTPVVFDGRVCAIGRSEEGGQHINKSEVVACYDAEKGNLIWQRKMPVFLTTVPFTRAGWANLAADPETGYIFMHGIGGTFAAFDKKGEIVWEHSLSEKFSRFSGYGGRTHSPIVDGDLVILSFGVVGGWGSLAPPRHRYFAFDKRSGQVVWISQPAGPPADLNTYAVPVVAEIDGRRLLIHGNGDGFIYALEVNTGRMIWKFGMSKRGINTSVVVSGNRVYAAHGEENRDEASMGRVVAIDGTGSGDITSTHELWRNEEASSGFVSPLLVNDRLYVLNNSANLFALDTATGKTLWEKSLGTVGKGSPVYADGKIYATEVNGRFLIVEPGESEARILDEDVVNVPDGRYAEIYGSPAVAYGRIYFATENGLFCLGDSNKPFAKAKPAPAPSPAPAQGQAATLRIVPAEFLLSPGQEMALKVRSYDEKGRYLGDISGQWNLNNLKGSVEGNAFRADSDVSMQAGLLGVQSGELTATARVRVLPSLPIEVDFEGMEAGKSPPYFVGAAGRFQVRDIDGNKQLYQPPYPRSHDRGYFYLGSPDMTGYTVQADILGKQVRRKLPDYGLINNRYIFQVAGRKIQIFTWISEKRVDVRESFDWKPDVWYRMKLRVDVQDGQSIVRGKIWNREEAEPDWMITATDPQALSQGSPALFGVSRTEIFYDNVKVTANE